MIGEFQRCQIDFEREAKNKIEQLQAEHRHKIQISEKNLKRTYP